MANAKKLLIINSGSTSCKIGLHASAHRQTEQRSDDR
jgi:hypothetical protein